MTITTAAAAATDILAAAAQGDTIVFHNVALCSEVAFTLLRSKKAAVQAQGRAVYDAMGLYFEARNGFFLAR